MVDPGDYKRRMAAVYNLVSSSYDREALRFLRLCADRLIALVEIRRGQMVLDVAAGTGMAAIAAARAVGPRGRVIGVDLANVMLAKARRNAAAADVANIEFLTADAGDFPRCHRSR